MSFPESIALGAFMAFFGGFLIGSIPFGLVVGRLFFASDIRASGSGNIGAANALRSYGRGAGLAVLVLDALKGAVAVLLAARLDPTFLGLGAIAGLGAVLGHCYSPWLRFRGGKGVATFLGAATALSPWAGLAFVIVWAAIGVPTGYASAASIAATVVAAGVVAWRGGHFARGVDLLFGLVSVLVVVWRHRANLARLRDGTEPKTRVFGPRA